MRTISAPGKIVLWGEYAVLEGYEAAVAALSRRVYCSQSKATELCFTAPKRNPYSLKIQNGMWLASSEDNFFELAHHVIQTAVEQGIHINPARYHFESSELHLDFGSNKKLGLGSSAAISASLAAHLILDNCGELNLNKIFELAYTAHKRFNKGYGSGIDIAAAVYGKATTFRIASSSLSCSMPLSSLDTSFIKNNILLVYLGRNQSTKDYLHRVEQFKSSNHLAYKKLIESISKDAQSIHQAIKQKNFANIIKAINELNSSLKDLGKACNIEIITPEHQLIETITKKYNGAAKPCGAGGGDISMCIVEKDLINKLADDLKQANFFPLNISISENDGVREEKHLVGATGFEPATP